jgi:L-lactate dehydrogenase
MKIAIWGAGHVGRLVTYRFATLDFVSEIAWINRSLDKVECRRIDIDQGLAFAPACHTILAYEQKQAKEALHAAAILILALGKKVPPGGTREQVYSDTVAMFKEGVIPALKGFKGVVIVVTNPVDLMSRFVHVEGKVDAAQVIGLGTVVETARMQTFLRDYLTGASSARDIQAFAIGTHDTNFVPIIPSHFFAGETLKNAVLADARDMVKGAVGKAAERVKRDDISTLHPIVEGVVAIAHAVANDTHSLLTVSCLDPKDPDTLFYSLPCVVGNAGVLKRFEQVVDHPPELKQELKVGVDAMRAVLKNTSE